MLGPTPRPSDDNTFEPSDELLRRRLLHERGIQDLRALYLRAGAGPPLWSRLPAARAWASYTHLPRFLTPVSGRRRPCGLLRVAGRRKNASSEPGSQPVRAPRPAPTDHTTAPDGPRRSACNIHLPSGN